ncbi:MAG: radical SAM protein [Negativibacillus sp.]
MKLVWDITNQCNLNCKHCGANNSHSKWNLPKKNAIKFIDNVKEYVDEVDILGGEPLFYPHIFDVIEKLVLEKKKINIITNGQFESSVAKNLLKYPIKSIFVSFEGLEPENDLIRGKGSWNKAIIFLKNLLDERKNKLTFIGVNIVINKINKNKLLPIIDFFDNLMVDYIQFNPLFYDGNAEINKSDLYLSEEEKLDAYEIIAEKHAGLTFSKLLLNSEYPLINRYLNLKYGTSFQVSVSECGAFVDSFFSNNQGIIYPCRKYATKKHIETIDLFEKQIYQFQDFLSISCIPTERKCLDCEFQPNCHPCPLNPSTETPIICKLVKNRMDKIDLKNKSFSIRKGSVFVEKNDHYFGYFPRLEYKTEYTKEGYNILKLCERGFNTAEISELSKIPFNDVITFLLQENKKGKVTME